MTSNTSSRRRSSKASASTKRRPQVRRRPAVARKYRRMRQMWEKGKPSSEIAAATGYDVDRLRVVMFRLRKKHGWFPLRQHQARGRTALAQKYRPWRRMWDEGMTLLEMSKRVDRSFGCVVSTVTNLRHKYGWFPKRVKKARVRPRKREIPSERMIERYAPWRPMWESGKTIAEIAQASGVATETAAKLIWQFRRRFGWFPKRRFNSVRELAKRYAPWRRMWARNLTYAQIASAVGHSTHTVDTTISRLRARFGWFKLRRT